MENCSVYIRFFFERFQTYKWICFDQKYFNVDALNIVCFWIRIVNQNGYHYRTTSDAKNLFCSTQNLKKCSKQSTFASQKEKTIKGLFIAPKPILKKVRFLVNIIASNGQKNLQITICFVMLLVSRKCFYNMFLLLL